MITQEIYSAFAFAFIVALGCFSHFITHYIKVQVLTEENEIFHSNAFIATRAYKDLAILNDFGPKATGSFANEVLTVNYLLRRANEIKTTYDNVSEISIDLQVVSGSHFDSAHYRNIQNVVVKLHGRSDNALMINCHFDSEYGSYGAGDDNVNCCIMLEILRVMAKSGEKNENSIIFLFNGSEEGNLEGIQASHAFITQHKWREDVKTFINLEAQGIGGRELLFRSGPKHDWLIEKYRQGVVRPFGQVIAEELFETNLLKSGTDFESFRDAGNVPGLDLAYCSGGWKYHTKFDHIRYVTKDSIQNTGNNVLGLVKLMANSDELKNPPEGNPAVYYDFWGLFLVSYAKTTGAVINIIVSILAVSIPYLVQTKLKVKNFAWVLRETLMTFVTFTVGVVLSFAACFTLSLIMNAADNTMFWFNVTFLSLGVYSTLALIVQIGVFHIFTLISKAFERKSLKEVKKFDERKKIQAHLNGINLFWAVLTVIATSFGLRVGYVTMVILVISLVTNLMMYILHAVLPKMRLHSWIFVHFFGHSLSFLWASYLLFILWRVFIPITEKTFYTNPEITISLLCCLMTTMTLSYFIPLTSLVKSRAILYTSLTAIFIVSLIIAFTPAGFPYSGSLAEPRVQRHYVTHTQRTFYDEDGDVRFSDKGFFIKENERNTKRTLESFIDARKLLPKDDDVLCKSEAFCGVPSYNMSNGFWLYSETRPVVEPTQLKLTSRLEDENSVEMSFDIVGELLTLIFIAPEPGVVLTESSIGFSSREWIEGRTAHFLRITYGKPSKDPLKFTLKLEKLRDLEDLVKITIVTIDSHFDKSPMTSEFKDFVDSFPDYTFVQVHQADLSSFTFQ